MYEKNCNPCEYVSLLPEIEVVLFEDVNATFGSNVEDEIEKYLMNCIECIQFCSMYK